jgi:methyl-accepting chemotaxis protein
MCAILNLLIVFFVLLIGTQIFLAYSGNIIEGMDNNNDGKNYQEYDGNDALILSKQNAANIQFLKQQFDGINGLQGEVNDLSSNVAALQTQVDGLVQSQQDYTNNITSSNSELSTSYNDSSTTDSNTYTSSTPPDTTTSGS